MPRPTPEEIARGFAWAEKSFPESLEIQNRLLAGHDRGEREGALLTASQRALQMLGSLGEEPRSVGVDVLAACTLLNCCLGAFRAAFPDAAAMLATDVGRGAASRAESKGDD